MRSLGQFSVVALAACGFSKSTESSDAKPVLDDAGREIRKWDFDSATDFGAAGAETLAMTIDPRGSLTPNGYVYGALIARGVQGVKLWSNTDSDWSKTVTQTPTAIGLWQGNNLDINKNGVGNRDVSVLGITNTSMTSVWFEGEIWVNAPGESFRITGDDTAFLYIALDGVNFAKIAQNGTGSAGVASSGWYPVRIGWSDGNNSGDIVFEANSNEIEHTRLRAATSMFRGMYRTVYYREVLGGGIPSPERLPVTSIQDTAMLGMTSFNPPLPGSFTTGTTPFDWSVRWTGQFYAAAAGAYTMQITSNDGCRLRLGTVADADRFDRASNGNATCTATATLVEGWNDLIAEFTHVDTTPSFRLNITAAPAGDAALMGMAIPRERLRPIEPRALRAISKSDVTATTIQDNQPASFATQTVNVKAAPGETVVDVAITARVVTAVPAQMNYRIQYGSTTQSITPSVVADPNPVTNSRIAYDVITVPANTPANGLWSIGIADNSNTNPDGDSQFEELHITLRTTGGREQIATSSTWHSPVVANDTNVSLVDYVMWNERVPAGASVAVRMRTCGMPDCRDGEWSAAITNGMAPMLPPNRYVQLEVAMTSDGTLEPEVNSINVQYRTDPKPM